jgi:hypothetical protein
MLKARLVIPLMFALTALVTAPADANIYMSNNQATPVPAGQSLQIGSNDILLTCTSTANLVAADAQLTSPDGAVFTIGQLQFNIQYLNASFTPVGTIELPAQPSLSNVPVFENTTFYATSLLTPASFDRGDVFPTAYYIVLNATAIIQNTTGAAHTATLAIGALFNSGGCGS